MYMKIYHGQFFVFKITLFNRIILKMSTIVLMISETSQQNSITGLVPDTKNEYLNALITTPWGQIIYTTLTSNIYMIRISVKACKVLTFTIL